MVSPEMLPDHLRNIKKRLVGTPSSVRHDKMILEQAAEALDDGGSNLVREWMQKASEVKRGQKRIK